MAITRTARTNRATYSLLDDLVEPAPTLHVTYRCPDGHTFRVRLYAEADVIPVRWACRTCGAAATTDVTDAVEVPTYERRGGAPSKTPWQQLRERRSIPELEALLDERLALLRGRDGRDWT